MASSHVKHQFKQDTLPKGNFQHGTNGTVSHKVDKSNSDRTERRKEWWNKKKKSNLESTEGSTMEKTTPGVISLEIGKEKSYESQAQRPKLRNRETISKPDSLKYEPDFNRGFHNKIMQNLFTDTSKKKKISNTKSSMNH